MNDCTLLPCPISSGTPQRLAALSLAVCFLTACSSGQAVLSVASVNCPAVYVETSAYDNQIAHLLQSDYSADSLILRTIIIDSHAVRFIGFLPSVLSIHYDNLHGITTVQCAAGTINHNYIYIVVTKDAAYILRMIAQAQLLPNHIVEDRLPSADDIFLFVSGNVPNPNVIRVDEAKIYAEDGLFASIKQRASSLDSRLVPFLGVEYREQLSKQQAQP